MLEGATVMWTWTEIAGPVYGVAMMKEEGFGCVGCQEWVNGREIWYDVDVEVSKSCELREISKLLLNSLCHGCVPRHRINYLDVGPVRYADVGHLFS